MKISIYKIIIVLFPIIAVSSNYPNISSTFEVQGDYLPDLKFKNSRYKYLRHDKKSPNPNMPRRTIRPSIYAIEFVVSISNIGTGNWDNDLEIRYFFEDRYSVNEDSIIFNNLFIPYASEVKLTFEVKSLSTPPKSITIYLNSTKHDSLEQYRIYEEFFYNNNLIQINLE